VGLFLFCCDEHVMLKSIQANAELEET